MNTDSMESDREKTMNFETKDKSENTSRVKTKITVNNNFVKNPIGNRAEDRHNERVIDDDYRRTVEAMMKGVADLPKNWDDMTIREQRDWIATEWCHAHPNMPKTLTFLCTGAVQIRQCDRSINDPKPEWFDQEKFLRGQRFAMDHFGSLCLGELLSLYVLYSLENTLKPIISTGRSNDPFQSFKRYLSTSERIRSWYSSDPWTKGTLAHRNMVTVRRMHSIVCEGFLEKSLDEIDEVSKIDNAWCITREKLQKDFRESCPPLEAGQCPFVFAKDAQFKRTKGITQGDMATTQGAFTGFVILYPEYLGIHDYSDDDLDAYCHVWRCIGYLLGIEDEFNFCTGTLGEVKQRMRDFLDHWMKPNLREITPEWEHILRCVVEGVTYYFPFITYEQGLLYVMHMLDIPVRHFASITSLSNWCRYQIMILIFYWAARFSSVLWTITYIFEKSVNRALSYTKQDLAILREKSRRTLDMSIKGSNVASLYCSKSLITKFLNTALPTLIFIFICLLLNFSIYKSF